MKTLAPVPLVLKQIWTYGHRPFVMGGSVNYLLACNVECSGPHKLGKGYEGYVATAPNGKTFVAESLTGAIVGDTLESVRADIKAAKPAVMRKQVDDALARMRNERQQGNYEVKDADFFWRAMRCA
jgi:hypothetical protein